LELLNAGKVLMAHALEKRGYVQAGPPEFTPVQHPEPGQQNKPDSM